jgi:hypothetical protein
MCIIAIKNWKHGAGHGPAQPSKGYVPGCSLEKDNMTRIIIWQ